MLDFIHISLQKKRKKCYGPCYDISTTNNQNNLEQYMIFIKVCILSAHFFLFYVIKDIN